MRLTNCRVALTVLFLVLFPILFYVAPLSVSLSSFSRFSILFLPFLFPFLFISFIFPFSFSHSIFRLSPIFKWQILRVPSAAKEVRAISTFSPTHPTLFSLSLPSSLSFSFSRSSASSRSFASPRYLVGHVLLPVFLLHPFSQASLI